MKRSTYYGTRHDGKNELAACETLASSGVSDVIVRWAVCTSQDSQIIDKSSIQDYCGRQLHRFREQQLGCMLSPISLYVCALETAA